MTSKSYSMLSAPMTDTASSWARSGPKVGGVNSERDDDQDDLRAATARLRELRLSIDNMDAALVHLLAERFKITQQVGLLKAEHGLPPADPQREAEQVDRLRALAVESNLDPEFAEKFLNFIIAEVVRHHESIAARSPR